MEELKVAVDRFWGWSGLRPKQVLERNAFGNLLVLDQHDRYWRICPEELSCTVIAESAADFSVLRADAEFQVDWLMSRLCDIALEVCGPISESRTYCLKVPAVLGGAYEASNIGDI